MGGARVFFQWSAIHIALVEPAHLLAFPAAVRVRRFVEVVKVRCGRAPLPSIVAVLF
jgi:hypothetical protein